MNHIEAILDTRDGDAYLERIRQAIGLHEKSTYDLINLKIAHVFPDEPQMLMGNEFFEALNIIASFVHPGLVEDEKPANNTNNRASQERLRMTAMLTALQFIFVAHEGRNFREEFYADVNNLFGDVPMTKETKAQLYASFLQYHINTLKDQLDRMQKISDGTFAIIHNHILMDGMNINTLK